jgi:hypothetical protein
MDKRPMAIRMTGRFEAEEIETAIAISVAADNMAGAE